MATPSCLNEIHTELCSLGRAQAQLDRDLGRTVLRAYRHAVHVSLGYASFREYTERFLGWTGRQTEERVRVALALESLPGLSNALATGALTWSAVRELTRVATAETESEWMNAATGKTTSQVERLVSGRAPGARPSDSVPPEAERRHISLNVSASSYALFEDLRRALTAELGGFVDDDALVAAVAGSVLGGTDRDESRGNYQIALQLCDRCSHAERLTGSQPVSIDPSALAAAQCDAQIIENTRRVDATRMTQTIPPRTRRAVLLRHGKRYAVPGCKHRAFLDVHHTQPRAEGGTHDPEQLIVLCGAHHDRVHEGRLVIRGSYSSGFAFEHADGTPYGMTQASPATSDTFRIALAALTSLGFQSREAQTMVDTIRPRVGANATPQDITRSALRYGAPPTRSGVRERPAVYQRTPRPTPYAQRACA